jgi:hypothetical protein
MNKGSFSSQDLKDAIEMKIFTEKSYGEKVGYYFSEQDYEKECPETLSGKHVWVPKQTIEKDQITRSQFQNYVSNEKNRVHKEKQEKDKEANEKKLRIELCMNFIENYNQLKKNRLKASELLRINEIDDFLLIQEKICNSWRSLDSLFKEHYYFWLRNFENNPEKKFVINTLDDYYSNIILIDTKGIQQDRMSKYLYSDASEYARIALANNQFERAFKFLIPLFERYRKYDRTYNWFSDDFALILTHSKDAVNLARYISHLGYFALNDKNFLYYPLWVVKNTPLSSNWYKIMIDDYSEFGKRGILRNSDSLTFILKLWSGKSTIKISSNAPKNTQNIYERNTDWKSVNRRALNQFLYNIVFNFDIQDKESNTISKVIEIDKNLYLFKYPQYRVNFNTNKTSWIKVYFYLNNDGDVIIVNNSGMDLSDKKRSKIIEKSKEIRDKDLNLVPQN